MYAVVQIGGHQYKVAQNDVIFVDRQQNDVDESVSFDKVLLVADGDDLKVGTPVVEGAKIEATVLDNLKAEKVIVFKKKRRKGYQKSNGHRQHITQLRIDNITV